MEPDFNRRKGCDRRGQNATTHRKGTVVSDGDVEVGGMRTRHGSDRPKRIECKERQFRFIERPRAREHDVEWILIAIIAGEVQRPMTRA